MAAPAVGDNKEPPTPAGDGKGPLAALKGGDTKEEGTESGDEGFTAGGKKKKGGKNKKP